MSQSKETITVEAELHVTSRGNHSPVVVHKFDRAWALGKQFYRESGYARVKFIRFARKDD